MTTSKNAHLATENWNTFYYNVLYLRNKQINSTNQKLFLINSVQDKMTEPKQSCLYVV